MAAELPLDIETLIHRALRQQVRLPEFSQPVYIEDAQGIDDLVSLSVRTRDGQTGQTGQNAEPQPDLLSVPSRRFRSRLVRGDALEAGAPQLPPITRRLLLPGNQHVPAGIRHQQTHHRRLDVNNLHVCADESKRNGSARQAQGFFDCDGVGRSTARRRSVV